MYGPDMLK